MDNKPTAHASEQGKNKEEVYVLELKHGFIYVGRGHNRRIRIQQHNSGEGSEWTRLHHVVRELLCLSETAITVGGDDGERSETLSQMCKHGIDNVRGWRWTKVTLTVEDKKDIEKAMREKFNLCRRCGREDHFVGDCPARMDSQRDEKQRK
uniref:GIY-YIG catalytic domain protein n=1 Tax=Marseillevirus LCMAC102 TaxID=2506603 RepID=A0A481YSM5_9VIRU|nr:MAG: GIY-YIG catalytic domain protein [Marseillevirus LCMAC102]